jgi:ribonuclease HI
MWCLYSDGGSRGNPGPAGCGAVLLSEAEAGEEHSGTTEAELCRWVGARETNNVAEYHGLLLGLEEAQRRSLRGVRCFLDSLLVVQQVRGAWRVKTPHLVPLRERARALLDAVQGAVHHVPRQHNTRADALANRAMDEGAAGPA